MSKRNDVYKRNFMAQKLFDYNLALERLGGDEQFLNELLMDLIEQIDDTLDNIKQAIAEEDFENLKTLSHSLKGASANLNVSRMASHFLQLEGLGMENTVDGASDLIELVTKDRNDLEAFLNQMDVAL